MKSKETIWSLIFLYGLPAVLMILVIVAVYLAITNT